MKGLFLGVVDTLSENFHIVKLWFTVMIGLSLLLGWWQLGMLALLVDQAFATRSFWLNRQTPTEPTPPDDPIQQPQPGASGTPPDNP